MPSCGNEAVLPQNCRSIFLPEAYFGRIGEASDADKGLPYISVYRVALLVFAEFLTLSFTWNFLEGSLVLFPPQMYWVDTMSFLNSRIFLSNHSWIIKMPCFFFFFYSC
ncbi:hypothetical protein POVWA2_027280 [Plasmodium ovale wallikeri]|uniref:Uncharacterized protein n=1 Tax=Plasmodium ovale wallikeri TaxID=864142 RepID=A0A1A8YV44_PLAOA|nr:hypothetical protein POVWA1_027120 [Plasmodium ovale wallikeri]SBT35906.1 hypothetical protein POVWA2_027280 [Plasmodium ovale wallikeri]